LPETVRAHSFIDVSKRLGAGLIYRPDTYTTDRGGHTGISKLSCIYSV